MRLANVSDDHVLGIRVSQRKHGSHERLETITDIQEQRAFTSCTCKISLTCLTWTIDHQDPRLPRLVGVKALEYDRRLLTKLITYQLDGSLNWSLHLLNIPG